MARWQRELDDPALERQAAADKLEGLRNGAKSTPALFFNRKLYVGIQTEVELTDRVEEELDL